MGWCHEFGSQIRHGCDHPMVAGENSCSCPGCGVRCTGKFASCDLVWRRGPRQVTLVRPVHEHGAAASLDAGTLALNPGRPLALAPAASAPVRPQADDIAWLATTLEGLRSDLRALREAVESGQESSANGTAPPDPATDRLVALVEGLPERIGAAVSRAVDRTLDDWAPARPSPDGEPPPARRDAAGTPSGATGTPSTPNIESGPSTAAVPQRRDAEPPDRPAPDAPRAVDDDDAGETGPPSDASARPVREEPREAPAGAPLVPEDALVPADAQASGGLLGWEALRARLSTWASKPTGTG